MIVAIFLFVAGVAFLAALIIGLLVEWIAGKFAPDLTARFGGFCFALGFFLARGDQLVGMTGAADAVATVVGAIAALAWLGRRALQDRDVREAAS